MRFGPARPNTRVELALVGGSTSRSSGNGLQARREHQLGQKLIRTDGNDWKTTRSTGSHASRAYGKRTPAQSEGCFLLCSQPTPATIRASYETLCHFENAQQSNSCAIRQRLTLRSSGHATACHAWPSFHSGPCAPRRVVPLTSNVRCHEFTRLQCLAFTSSAALLRLYVVAARPLAVSEPPATCGQNPREHESQHRHLSPRCD